MLPWWLLLPASVSLPTASKSDHESAVLNRDVRNAATAAGMAATAAGTLLLLPAMLPLLPGANPVPSAPTAAAASCIGCWCIGCCRLAAVLLECCGHCGWVLPVATCCPWLSCTAVLTTSATPAAPAATPAAAAANTPRLDLLFLALLPPAAKPRGDLATHSPAADAVGAAAAAAAGAAAAGPIANPAAGSKANWLPDAAAAAAASGDAACGHSDRCCCCCCRPTPPPLPTTDDDAVWPLPPSAIRSPSDR